MTVYAIAQISVTDRDSYNKYQSRFMKVFGRFNGTLLAADADPEVIEGDWTREKVILMSFPDAQSFRHWAQAPEYQNISIDRKAGSEGIVLLVRGLS